MGLGLEGRMKRICILGSGAAGLLVLYNLEKAGVDPSTITVIDPTHTGGDLMNKWAKVRSNTTWRQIFEAVPSRSSFAEPWTHLNPDEPVELRLVIKYLQSTVKDYLSKTTLRTDLVSSVQRHGETSWKLLLKHGKQPVFADVVFFCQGSDPKSLDLPFPTIPLEVALDRQRLSEWVTPTQHILLFGTAHSGALIAKHLVDCGAQVTNFYATEKPFYFASEGAYDGVKQDAEVIARAILQGAYPSLTLESVHDLSALIRASKTASACVYACGFEPRLIGDSWSYYDGKTGRLEETTTAWGFGIAYPNKASDDIHWDVSIPAFQAHIQAQMPSILTALQTP